jgi:hypothetical protein
MRFRLAITSGLVFSITWPRLHNPVARSCVTFSLRFGALSPSFGRQNCLRAMSSLSYALLQQQSAATSNALMDHWLGSTDFQKLAKYEGDMTVARDNEDGEKLQIGIDYAKQKGVIDPDFVPEPYVKIDVLGKTPAQVADEIIAIVQKKQSEGGSVIVLCGLSGTGKVRTLSCEYYVLQYKYTIALLIMPFFIGLFPRYNYSGNDGGQLATEVGGGRGQTGSHLVQWQHF